MKRYMLFSLFILMLLSVMLPVPTHAQTIRTCDFDTLKSAIGGLNADGGGIITLDCAGTIRFTETLAISSDVILNGTDAVILDGYGLYTLFDVEASFTLNGIIIQTAWIAIRNRGTLTISDSLFRDNQAYESGSALMNHGTATIINSTFIRNETDFGGVIWNAGVMTIADSEFVMNKAYSSGGVIRNDGNLTITRSEFSHNHAENGFGGVIDNSGMLAIATSTFNHNEAYSGGVIANWYEIKIEDSRFISNHASSGGGVMYGEGKMVILNSQFMNNDANWGGVIVTQHDIIIRNSYFEGNHAQEDAGVISKWTYWDATDGYVMSITHSTFIKNHAGKRGGVIEYDNTTQVAIHNNTFFKNEAHIGGAIYGHDESGATILHNTFVDNEGMGAAIYTNSPTQIRYNLFSGTPQTKSLCSGLYAPDVDTTNLTDYRCGDAVRVNDLMLGEFDGQIFPLLVGSPAIDGYPRPCQMSNDQLGIPRPRADACDIGAVEWLPAGDVVITEPQSVTLTDCTWNSLYEAVTNLNWAGGDIRLSCPEDTIIPFIAPLLISSQLSITSDNPIRFDGDDKTQLFRVDATGELSLDGLTLVNGYHEMGGAIYNDGELTLTNMIFIENEAGQGGAIWNNGNLTMTNSQFDQNSANMGGAVYNRGQLTISDSLFTNHRASKGTEDKFKLRPKSFTQYEEEPIAFTQVGGAIYTNSWTNITHSRFENNWADEAGGAVFVDLDGVLNITDSHFSLNEAHEGGALYYLSNPEYEPLGAITPQNQLLSQPNNKNGGYRYKQVAQYTSYHFIHDSVFENNSATNGGAIYNATWRTFYTRGNLFIGNYAVNWGGAIRDWGDMFVSQNTFIENRADIGGAAHGIYGSNNTFLRNSAITEGGAIYVGHMMYSTFVDNTAPIGGAFSDARVNISVIIGDAPQCNELRGSDEDINFATTTCGNAIIIPREYLLLGEFDGRVFPLLSGSPLIDFMDTCPQWYRSDKENPVDQLGTQRPQGDGCDIGAVEFVGENTPALDNLTITDCTLERLYQSILYAPILSGTIQLDCPEDSVITFTQPFLITSDISITNIGAEVTFEGSRQTHFFNVASDVTFTLDGITLRNGFTRDMNMGSAIVNDGELHILNSHFENQIEIAPSVAGAIVNFTDGDITIENSTFTGHSTQLSGAVIVNYGNLTIRNSLFSDNRSNFNGGAIRNYHTLFVSDSQFINNQAMYSGGAIYNEGWLLIRHNTFMMNSASQSEGGAIFIEKNDINGYQAEIEDTLFDANTANNGGAIYIAGQARILVRGSQFINNSAQINGGAIYMDTESTLSVEHSQFANNSAQMNGGAIYNEDAVNGITTITHSTFFQNTANTGGAVVNAYSISNSTFVENNALTNGGAIIGGQVDYSTFVDNTAPIGGAIADAFLDTSIVSGIGSQCYHVGMIGEDSINITDVACAEAQVVDNLGLGEFDGTVVPLLPNSPAIDILPFLQGYHSCPMGIHIDQLGTQRPQGEGCDIGAVEFVDED